VSIALLLIPLGLLLLGVAVGAFFWAVDHEQFDDLDHVADSALDDDPPPAALPNAPPRP
jgi:cbb3-type cytochrome oxidase maturation protein